MTEKYLLPNHPPPQVQSSPRMKFQHIEELDFAELPPVQLRSRMVSRYIKDLDMDVIVLPPGNGSLIIWEDEEQGSR